MTEVSRQEKEVKKGHRPQNNPLLEGVIVRVGVRRGRHRPLIMYQ